MTTLFISHSSTDHVLASELKSFLEHKGYLDQFLDSASLKKGKKWAPQLARNLKRSDLLIFLCTESSIASKWCMVELILARQAGVNILSVELDGTQTPNEITEFQTISFNETRSLQGSFEEIESAIRTGGLLPEYSIARDRGVFPFPGLSPFDETLAGYFRGRESEIEKTIRLLEGRQNGLLDFEMLYIQGASGSGKTSLLKAGILPFVNRRSKQWIIIDAIRPSVKPITCLCNSIHSNADRLGIERPPNLYERAMSSDGTASLLEAFSRLTNHAQSEALSILLPVDQLEEITVGIDDRGRESNKFIDILPDLLNQPNAPICISTVRSDLFDEVQKVFSSVVALAQPLSILDVQRKYRELIIKPALDWGVGVSETLASRIILDLESVPKESALPLLALTLSQLFTPDDVRRDNELGEDDYELRVKSIRDVLKNTVASGIAIDKPEESKLRLRVLLGLIQPHPEDTDAIVRRQLDTAFLSSDEKAYVEGLVKRRILVPTADDTGVELIHECLIEIWPELNRAGEKHRSFLDWKSTFETLYQTWATAKNDAKHDLLLTWPQVMAAKEHLESELALSLPKSQQQYFDKSLKARKRSKRLQAGAALVVAFLVLAATGAAVAYRVIESEGKKSFARLVMEVADSHGRNDEPGIRAVLLANALRELEDEDPKLASSIRSSITAATESLLPRVGHFTVDEDIRTCAISPNGEVYICVFDRGKESSGLDALGAVYKIDVENGIIAERVEVKGFRREQLNEGIYDIMFDPVPAHNRFAIATSLGWIHVVDSEDMEVIHSFKHEGRAVSLDFSANGKKLLVAARRDDKKRRVSLAIYETDHWQSETIFDIDDELYAARFNSTGTHVVAVGGLKSGNAVSIWSLAKPETPVVSVTNFGRVFCTAFHPTEDLVAFGDVNGEVRIVELTDFLTDQSASTITLEGLAPRFKQDGAVRILDFDESGTYLLAGGEDTTARVYDTRSMTSIGQKLEHTGKIYGGCLLGRISRVVTLDMARTVRVWEFKDSSPFRHDRPIVDVCKDGQRILVSSFGDERGPGRATLWRDSKYPIHLEHGKDVLVSRFNPADPNQVVTCGNDGVAHVWDLSEPKQIASLKFDGVIRNAVFTPDGKTLALAGNRGGVYVFNSGKAPRLWQDSLVVVQKDVQSYIWNLACDPSGNLYADGGESLLVISPDGTTREVSAWTRKERDSQAVSGEFSNVELRLGGLLPKSGNVLASRSNGTVGLVDLKSESFVPFQMNGRPYEFGSEVVQACCKDSDIAAVGDARGILTVWDANRNELLGEYIHSSPIEAVSLSKAGDLVLTGQRNGTVALLARNSGELELVANWYHRGPVATVSFVSDSFQQDEEQLLSASRAGTILLTRIPDPYAREPAVVLREIEQQVGITIEASGRSDGAGISVPVPIK